MALDPAITVRDWIQNEQHDKKGQTRGKARDPIPISLCAWLFSVMRQSLVFDQSFTICHGANIED